MLLRAEQSGTERNRVKQADLILELALSGAEDLKDTTHGESAELMANALGTDSTICAEVQDIPIYIIDLSTTPIGGAGSLIYEFATTTGATGINPVPISSVGPEIRRGGRAIGSM